MSRDEFAADWPPLLARLAMMKGEGRGPGGRHSHIDHLERLAALSGFRGGPFGEGPCSAEAEADRSAQAEADHSEAEARSAAVAAAGAAATSGWRC